MEYSTKEWLTVIAFEHACKNSFDIVVKNLIQDKDLAPKLAHFSLNKETKLPKKPQVKPVLFFVSLLKKIQQLLNNLSAKESFLYVQILPAVVKLLESTYHQCIYMPIKNFLHFISELKLLDLMNLLKMDAESPNIIAKLNLHFPRWNLQYRSSLEKDFNIQNVKILEKVEESHTQCRRLILKLAVDQTYRSSYMSDQFSKDVQKIIKECDSYLNDVIAVLERNAGASIIEKIINGEEHPEQDSSDLSHHLLLDYLQPNMSDRDLLNFLEDMDPESQTQQSSSLTSCLLPFDIMSDSSESDSDNDFNSSSEEEKPDEDKSEMCVDS